MRFGGVTAVDRLSLIISAGCLTGIIGPNGAGKTTFIDAVTGLVRAMGGSIRFSGEVDQRQGRPPAGSRSGLGRTFQSLELFEDLTIRENPLLAAAETSRWWSPVV